MDRCRCRLHAADAHSKSCPAVVACIARLLISDTHEGEDARREAQPCQRPERSLCAAHGLPPRPEAQGPEALLEVLLGANLEPGVCRSGWGTGYGLSMGPMGAATAVAVTSEMPCAAMYTSASVFPKQCVVSRCA